MMHKTIQTVSGRTISFLKPEENDYSIIDIAHALSRLCRFNGHCMKFYSVAQHSVSVSLIVRQELALEALLHDAAEAYLGDISSPLKSILGDFRRIEEEFDRALRRAHGLPPEMHPEVKAADLRLLATEQRDLMPVLLTPWDITVGVAPLMGNVKPLAVEDAQKAFLVRYYELTKKDPL